MFTSHLPSHFCAGDIQGILIENNIKSFCDFIKSCALTLTHTEPESLSTTDCASSGQGRQASCLENLIQVQHTPEKGAIPKTARQKANKTPEPKGSIQTEDQDDWCVIVLDTPPDPSKSKSGKQIAIPEDNQIINVDEYSNKRKRDDDTRNASQASNKSTGLSLGKSTEPSKEIPSTSHLGTQTSFQDLFNIRDAPVQKPTNQTKKNSAPVAAQAGDNQGRHRPNKDGSEPRVRQRSKTPTRTSAEVSKYGAQIAFQKHTIYRGYLLFGCEYPKYCHRV